MGGGWGEGYCKGGGREGGKTGCQDVGCFKLICDAAEQRNVSSPEFGDIHLKSFLSVIVVTQLAKYCNERTIHRGQKKVHSKAA